MCLHWSALSALSVHCIKKNIVGLEKVQRKTRRQTKRINKLRHYLVGWDASEQKRGDLEAYARSLQNHDWHIKGASGQTVHCTFKYKN